MPGFPFPLMIAIKHNYEYVYTKTVLYFSFNISQNGKYIWKYKWIMTQWDITCYIGVTTLNYTNSSRTICPNFICIHYIYRALTPRPAAKSETHRCLSYYLRLLLLLTLWTKRKHISPAAKKKFNWPRGRGKLCLLTWINFDTGIDK